MATKSQKIRVGLFAAIALALLATVVIVFGGMRFWEGKSRYHIVFEGTVYGLEDGALVYFNGMRVGAVDGIGVDPDDLRKVRVTINVRENTPVKIDTKAMLQFAGITGLKVIDLRDGTAAAPRLPEGGTIAAGETVLDKLEKQAETLVDQSTRIMDNANRVMENLVALTDPAKFEGMQEIVGNARLASQNLVRTSEALDGIVRENRIAIRESVEAVEESAKTASAMLDGQVSLLVANANDLVTSLKGMVTSNQGALRAAVFDLRQASRSFKELAREVRQRPSRLLFSRPPSERKLP